jgi:hypothetical protein
MTGAGNLTDKRQWNYWRIARWGGAGCLLLIPLVMMQFSDEWNWTAGSFLGAAIVLAAFGLVYEIAERLNGSVAYRGGVAVALMAIFLTVWTTVVRDDGNAAGYFMVILAVGVGAFASWFRSAGLARTMFGVAAMQVMLGSLIATAPITMAAPGESIRTLLINGFFTVLWLFSTALFRAAATRESGPA